MRIPRHDPTTRRVFPQAPELALSPSTKLVYILMHAQHATSRTNLVIVLDTSHEDQRTYRSLRKRLAMSMTRRRELFDSTFRDAFDMQATGFNPRPSATCHKEIDYLWKTQDDIPTILIAASV